MPPHNGFSTPFPPIRVVLEIFGLSYSGVLVSSGESNKSADLFPYFLTH